MKELKVIRTEDERLIVATDSGETFALVIDDVLRAEVRRAQTAPETGAARPSPREIQAAVFRQHVAAARETVTVPADVFEGLAD